MYVMQCTVPLKSKLTLETRVSRIEKQGFLEYAKTRKGFEETIYFLKEEQYSTAHTYSKVQVFRVDHYRMKIRPKDGGLTDFFSETTCVQN